MLDGLQGWCLGLLGFQFALGLADVLLLAPVWMQIVHLLGADLYWVALVTLAAVVVWPEGGRTTRSRSRLRSRKICVDVEVFVPATLLRVRACLRSCRRPSWFRSRCPLRLPWCRDRHLCLLSLVPLTVLSVAVFVPFQSCGSRFGALAVLCALVPLAVLL